MLEHGDKVSPKPFLKTEQNQFSQAFLTWQAFQSFGHLCGPSLDPLQPFQSLLWAKTELNIPSVAQQVLSTGG